MKRPQIMGILNLTPDSFSGDGVVDFEEAMDRFAALNNAGADIVDIGAESTRPGATPLAPDEEWSRMEEVLQAIIPQEPLASISIDTRHASTAERALELGANLINDVSALQAPNMGRVLAQSNCDIVVMHSLTLPADKGVTWPEKADPLLMIQYWQNEVLRRAEAAKIDPKRIIWDPGIGFGKTARQSLALVLQLESLMKGGGRWLMGHSRKSFLKLLGEDRDALTLALSALMAEKQVDILRVHDVKAHVKLVDALCR